MKQLLTHSRMSSFKECRRKHQYSYEIGLRRIDESRALRMGSAFHSGIESLTKPATHTLLKPCECNCDKEGGCNICDGGLAYCKVCHGGEIELDQPCNLRIACRAVRSHYADMPEQFDSYEWEIECETILRLVCAYQWRWANMPLENVATEFGFQLPLLNPETGKATPIFDVAGKIDGIVRLEDGRLAIKETKTVSEDVHLDSDFWRRLRMDQQITLYIDAARRMGYQVDAVLYDVARKPSIKPTAVPILDTDGVKVVLDSSGERVRNKNGKSWRQTADTELGYVLQTRPMTVQEWGEKLTQDICERPQFYFARVEIARLDQDIEEFRHELWAVQQAVRDAQNTGRHFRTVNRHTCQWCDYFSMCCANQPVNSANPPIGFEILKNPHPELELTNVNGTSATSTTNHESTAAPAADCQAV